MFCIKRNPSGNLETLPLRRPGASEAAARGEKLRERPGISDGMKAISKKMCRPKTPAHTNTRVGSASSYTLAGPSPGVIENIKAMNFEEFENLARLYVVGALEPCEKEAFQEAKQDFGYRAEKLIAEFRQLNSVFALSLLPHPPHPDTKRKLLQAIRQTMHRDGQTGRNPLASRGRSQAFRGA